MVNVRTAALRHEPRCASWRSSSPRACAAGPESGRTTAPPAAVEGFCTAPAIEVPCERSRARARALWGISATRSGPGTAHACPTQLRGGAPVPEGPMRKARPIGSAGLRCGEISMRLRAPSAPARSARGVTRSGQGPPRCRRAPGGLSHMYLVLTPPRPRLWWPLRWGAAHVRRYSYGWQSEARDGRASSSEAPTDASSGRSQLTRSALLQAPPCYKLRLFHAPPCYKLRLFQAPPVSSSALPTLLR